MNQTYIIIFESLNKSNEVKTYLKTFNAYSPITKNSWAIRTDKTAAIVRDELLAIVEGGDKVFVIRSGTEAAWTNQTTAISDWLKKYL